ncbi:antimicrobial peptide system SdpB family protein [Curtobacterium flaccumfaciens]|nr:sporulation-delaying protein SdpB family protein [Curtobacterium flaccumfaciens]MDQ0540900.1 antimicrobial peptide system SdpB family protein [Curtobacterium flaccumfaciens]
MQLIFGELRPAVLRRTIDAFEIRKRQVWLGRSLIAVAQLSVILLTPYSALMQTLLGQAQAPTCPGIKQASIYCITKSAPHWVPTTLMTMVLLAVIFGVLPPLLSVLHAWVSFSIAVSIALPDGGDSAAVVFALLIIAISVGDNRRWIGQRQPASLPSWRRQVALAGLMMLRVQVAALYFDSAVGKVWATHWANGTEEYYVLRDPYFGASGFVGQVAEWMTRSALVTVSMSWGAMIIELTIAVLILCGPRARSFAVLADLFLHGFIILTIGLWSFGLIMIGAVVIAATPVTPRERSQDFWARGISRRQLPRRRAPQTAGATAGPTRTPPLPATPPTPREEETVARRP